MRRLGFALVPLLVSVLVAACSAGLSSSDSAQSDVKAAKGATGPTGPTGPRGATGPTGPTAETLLPQSGSRLIGQRQTAVGDDGSVEQVWVTGFWDSKLNTPCYRGTAGDGEQRCLPSGNMATLAVPYFADAACAGTRLAVQTINTIDGGSPDPLLPYVPDAWLGSPRVNYYRLGQQWTGAFYQLQQGGFDGGSGCVAATATWGQLVAYEVGAAVPPSEFVRFTVTATPHQ